ncbi:MAG: glutamine-hydrolyzing carbamoyl-phosphate synthase small subunit [Bacteroidota bacterium]|nr:glutamine-hydrolyzing carbamoyl-phosphate synthase small subunit [Bacteroidota bacterium]MDP4232641.1 glutamine-hydrolyzing carbamoyl-phosphate synthase small subunit [Bacteroidota bacterium]MDP4243893.1 glutamine-hydrolyzing carbamoyl-phosphate synthase small subunit [Bacteroidota bacterium]MDP4288438.1 glutamine-hydrolyzing carbamoyl-phosphate synthase small subunit [Bacteroidota bacterium]
MSDKETQSLNGKSPASSRMPARLVLENGAVFQGLAFGALDVKRTIGEAVFTTSITGYQEILTDPSYAGQIVTMTNPLMGNYGATHEDLESSHPFVSGFVVREASERYSNWRAEESLGDFLRKTGVLAIEQVDTRRLVRLLRSEGAMRSVLSIEALSDAELVEIARLSPNMAGLDLTKGVTTKQTYDFPEITNDEFRITNQGTESVRHSPMPHVVVLDYGIKQNILRKLSAHGARLTVMPSTTTLEEIMEQKPDGIFLSNGPGDPDAVKDTIAMLKHLIKREEQPIFGICLGHQLLSLALGGNTYKLKFGHRGANHPVKNLLSDKIEITSQNHGFAVDWKTMPNDCELTHLNLNDQTVEGFRHTKLPLFAVQYHPEASPGPHESDYLFSQFIEAMRTA